MMIVVDEHRAGDRRLEPGATPETTILPPARTSHPDEPLAVVRHLALEAIREMTTLPWEATRLMTRQRQANRAATKASVMMMAPTAVPVSSNNGRTRLTMP